MYAGALRAHHHPMETVNDNPPPPPPPPPPGAEPARLTRATDDKVVSGLCGGLGRYFGVDPVVFRIAFVVLALAGGSGLLLYLVGWVLIPDDTGRTGASALGGERNQKLVAAVLAGVGVLLLVDQVTGDSDADIPVGLVLLGIGALVLWSRRDGTPPPPPTTGPGDAPAGLAPPAPPPPVPDPPPAGMSDYPPPPPAAAVSDSPQPVRRSVLVPVTLSLLAVAGGVLALAGASLQTGLAVLLLMTGAALVVGSSRGRARWLIPVGLVLALALLGASALGDVPVRGGAGDRVYRPASLVEVASPYRLAAGTLTVDLGQLDLTDAGATVVASVGAGELIVTVPEDVAVELDTHVGVGELELLGRSWGGADVDQRLVEAGDEGGGRLVLKARVGLGHLEVRRAAA